MLNFIPKIIFVIPKEKKMPAGFKPTIEIYPIINGINVPQSPNAPPNSLKVNFLYLGSVSFLNSLFFGSNLIQITKKVNSY